jgi:hypothetical protein
MIVMIATVVDVDFNTWPMLFNDNGTTLFDNDGTTFNDDFVMVPSLATHQSNHKHG